MATFTTRLGLRKPAGTDARNVVTDLNENYDKIDDAVGSTVCTSTTRPASPFSGQTIFETDTKNLLVREGANWRHMSIPVVAATSSILVPYEGMLIYLTTDNMIYKYRSSTWVGCIATGTTFHEARYYQNAVYGTAISASVNTALGFNTVDTTTPDVTVSGVGNTDFTIVKPGLWSLSAGIQLAAGTSGERQLFVSRNGTTDRFAGDSSQTSLRCALNVSTDVRLAVNDIVRAYGWMTGPATLNIDVTSQMTHIALTWLRP